MSIKEDIDVVHEQGGDQRVWELFRETLDDIMPEILAAAAAGDSADVGRIMVVNLEETYRSEADYIQDLPPDDTPERRRLDIRDRVADMRSST